MRIKMALFGLGKKKSGNENSCCQCGNGTPEKMKQAEAEKTQYGVKILGGGCDKCKQLEEAVRKALEELGMNTDIDHVTDFEKITGTTPNELIHYPQKWYDDNDEHNPYWLASKWHPTVYTDKKHTKTKQLIL